MYGRKASTDLESTQISGHRPSALTSRLDFFLILPFSIQDVNGFMTTVIAAVI